MNRNIIILGNGFDLDLGLKTKYSDFAYSDCWPQHDGDIIPNLQMYLERKRDTESWFDIENEFLNYANRETINKLSAFQLASYNAERDMAYFVKIQEHLCQYIQKQQEQGINTESIAAKVLRSVIENGFFKSIYSFNYTDLNILARKLSITSSVNCTYIHGKVADKSIILGVDETKLMTGYELLHKTMSPHYRSHNIFNDLSVAKEVVFFGISFGQIDYTYFNRFFQSQSGRESIDDKNKKNITIFTKDESSRVDILKKFEEMGINRQNLFTQSHFQIIRTTDRADNILLDQFIRRLSRFSKKAYTQAISGIY